MGRLAHAAAPFGLKKVPDIWTDERAARGRFAFDPETVCMLLSAAPSVLAKPRAAAAAAAAAAAGLSAQPKRSFLGA